MVQKNMEWRRITSCRRRSQPSPLPLPGLRTQQQYALGALVEAGRDPSGGSLIQLNIGEGKTLVSFLAAKVLGCRKPLVVVMASIKHQTLADIKSYRVMGFEFPTPSVCSYRELSSKKWRDRLTHDIDLVVCDEAQKLKNSAAGVTTRVLQHCETQGARLVVLSANIVTTSILDIWHLGKLALGDRSPLPQLPNDAADWAAALDADVNPQHRTSCRALLEWPGAEFEGPQLARARAAWMRRVAETEGCYIQPVGDNPLPLIVEEWPCVVPPKADKALTDMRATWTRPDGHQLELASEFSQAARTLAYGFHHYWEEYPGEWWYDARKAFSRFVRRAIEANPTQNQTEGDVVRSYPEAPAVVDWLEAQRRWKPTPRVHWLDKSLCEAAAAWSGEGDGRILWYKHPTVGECLARHAPKGVVHYGAGSKEGAKLVAGRTNAIAPHPAHGTGLNLQRFWDALVLESPVAADKVNQLIGRLRRYGQTQTVTFRFPFHTPEVMKGWEKTVAGAEKLALMQQSQAILEGDWRL